MRKNKVFLSLLMTLFICSCQKSSDSHGSSSVASDVVDSAYCEPFFEDDGTMASLYEKNGYLYSANLEASASNGDLGAQKILVNMYAYGIGGVKPNIKKTYQLYRSMAEAGDAEAQAYAGYMLVYGVGPVEDVEAGMEWLEKSANQKCPMAFVFLADYFRKMGDDASAEKFNRIYQALVSHGDNDNINQ